MQRKDMSHIKIYHNPKCSNLRNALALIREHGYEPEVILYLDTPPTRLELPATFSQKKLQREKEH